jgi:hypothetical protein
MTPRLEARIARQAEVDTQCRHCSGGGACSAERTPIAKPRIPLSNIEHWTRGYCTRWRYRCSRPGPETNNLGLLTWRETRCEDSISKLMEPAATHEP